MYNDQAATEMLRY